MDKCYRGALYMERSLYRISSYMMFDCIPYYLTWVTLTVGFHYSGKCIDFSGFASSFYKVSPRREDE